jgi:hypothetical protein
VSLVTAATLAHALASTPKGHAALAGLCYPALAVGQVLFPIAVQPWTGSPGGEAYWQCSWILWPGRIQASVLLP